jgi:predicted nucleic-acid-binding protein
MLAADTNVVVRLIVSDDLSQQRAVHRRLEKVLSAGDSVVLSAVVLAELAWVLASVYEYGRPQIAAAVRAVVGTPPFVVPQRAEVLRALDSYEALAADFSDYLILELSHAEGASTLLTFDRKLLRHASCVRP